jgi:glycine hydroxymethyltransferase
MHIIAAKAVAFGESLQPDFKEYARQIVSNARTLARGLEAKGLRIVAGGTDHHLMRVDVSVRGLTGTSVEEYLDSIGITVNKNMSPFDRNPPAVSSGVRIGTPAVTTRGLREPEMEEIAGIIGAAIEDIGRDKQRDTLRARVFELTGRFGVP